ncbi:MAG: penicillin-binding protein beta-lactamase class [Actinomycetia bacterium]|nr:penicillin-binding protein beta-lactamase class [Actinomycetes bacterium]
MTRAPYDRRPVADPTDLGIDPSALEALFGRVQQDVDAGRLPSCQLALARDGQVAVWRAFGNGPVESRYVIFSATKAVVAGAVWVLIGEGSLDVSRTVASLIPEFAANDKDAITVEQVMLHTSGFPRAPFGALDWDDRERRLARFSKWRCNWEPGTRYEYHPTSAHWVLAEIIERLTGGDFRAFIRERILDPLGLAGLQVGVPIAEQGDINDLVLTGEATPPDVLEAAIGIREVPLTDVTPDALMSFNQPEVRAVGVPGGGGVSTAVDLALYYQALLADPIGIWKPEVLADATANVRNHLPDWMGTPANRSLGLIIAGDDGKAGARGMGHTVSARAFGHNGAGGQIAWADPATGLSFCYLTNGLDQDELRQWRRTTGIGSRAANCVIA